MAWVVTALVTIYFYFGRKNARTESLRFQKLLKKSWANEKLRNDDLRADLASQTEKTFKYSQMVADLRSRVRKHLAELEETIK